MTVPLPDAVRTRVVDLASQALDALEPARVPISLRRVASFAPARRSRVAGTQIAAVLARDDEFRAAVADRVGEDTPDLVQAVEEGSAVAAAEPVDVAALAYLLRPDGWEQRVALCAQALEQQASRAPDSSSLERLRQRLDAASVQLKESRSKHRERQEHLKQQNAELRRKLGEARARTRAAEEALAAVREAAVAESAASSTRASEQEAEARRLRARVERLEQELGAARRSERGERGAEALRARLLLDTLLESAQGLRRELALPAVDGAPADTVQAEVAEQGARTSSGQRSMSVGDPALLEHLLGLPRTHLVVDGYNVTKSTWPETPLEQQRDRLLSGLAPLAARSGAEVTVVFDAAQVAERPLVNRPRGVRVLYSPPGIIADDVIRDLVAVEPRGRPVVVVTSDQAVVDDVIRGGARAVAAAALARLLAPPR